MSEPLVLPLGEAAFTIRLAENASVANAERSAALAELIKRAQFEGVTDIVPAVASVSVFYDVASPHVGSARTQLDAFVRSLTSYDTGPSAFATHSIPTAYNGEDLDDVAQRVGLSRDEVIRRHTGREYRVLALGFLPGWAYLGALDPSLSLPRRTTPRTRVPAGSVAIMGEQTGIYPRVSPGGWHLIGLTDVVLFDASREQPALFRAGDRIRFVAK